MATKITRAEFANIGKTDSSPIKISSSDYKAKFKTDVEDGFKTEVDDKFGFLGMPKTTDTVSLSDVIKDTFHISGTKNSDGTRDFFGGDLSNEKLGQGIKQALNISTIDATPGRFVRQDGNKTIIEGEADAVTDYQVGDKLTPQQGNQQVRQAGVEIVKGLSDLANAGLIGMGTTAADIINLFDTENAVADYLRDDVREFYQPKQYYPDGAATAAGSELGSMAVEAPVAGKLVDIGLGAGKIARNALVSRTNTLAGRRSADMSATAKANKKFRRDNDLPKGITVHTDVDVGKPPGVGIISGLVGKVSPSAGKVIDKYWAKLLSPVSKKAAATTEQNFVNDLVANGVSKGRAQTILRRLYAKAGIEGSEKTAIDALLKSPSKTGALGGIGLGQVTD